MIGASSPRLGVLAICGWVLVYVTASVALSPARDNGQGVDCVTIRGVQTVTLPTPGYRWGLEFIPERAASPSADGQNWRCDRIDGSRQWLLAPPWWR